jgi:hemerythrin-like domain-containing protein
VLARQARRGAVEVEPESAWREVVFRFRRDLEPHFRIEEELLLPPLLEAGEEFVVAKTLDDHAILRDLARQRFTGGQRTELRVTLSEFGRRLDAHVRFEESILFETAERVLGDEVLEEIARAAPKPRRERPAARPDDAPSG